MSPLTTLIRHTSGSCNKVRKRNKKHIDWKGRSKTFLFVDNMITYVENPKEPTEKDSGTNKWV